MDEFQLYIILFTLAVILYAWFFTTTRIVSSKGRNIRTLPPSPPALPVIGNLHQLGRFPHRSLFLLSKSYGPAMYLKFGSKPVLVVSSAALAKEILKTHDIAFAGRADLSTAKKIFYDLKDLIYSQYGEEWRKLRSLFVHGLLGGSRVKSFNSIREDEISILVEKINKKCISSSSREAVSNFHSPATVNLTEMFGTLANNLISRAAFGKKHGEKHGGKLLCVIDRAVGLLSNLTVGEFVPWIGWINRLIGHDAALDECAKEIDEILDLIIEDHLRDGIGAGGEDDDNNNKENFMDILLGKYKGDVPGASTSIDILSVKGIIADVFGAGTDTSSATLVWVMTELIRHPQVMKKLQHEVREITKGKPHIGEEDLQKMSYLKAVIKETFRIHPTVAIYLHAAREYVNLMGYDIEPETIVLINAWAIGRDSSSWHDPGNFMPERFLNSSVDYRGTYFELIPFGAGRRICPGLEFAAANIEHTVANLVRNFDFALPGGAKSEDLDASERPGITIGKKEPLIVVPRLFECSRGSVMSQE
ncbi:hypothetical protein OROGR_004474 [Orobanche gracilis]